MTTNSKDAAPPAMGASAAQALLPLINAYGRACRRDGNPAWESDEGKALKAALFATAASTQDGAAQPIAKALTDEYAGMRSSWSSYRASKDQDPTPYAAYAHGWRDRALLAAEQPSEDKRAISPEQRQRIANIVHTECKLLPGATFYNAAEFAITATLAAIAKGEGK